MVEASQSASAGPGSSEVSNPLENDQALVEAQKRPFPDHERQKMKRPSPKAAIEAKCHACMAHYEDGRQDCEMTDCSLYYWQPYRQLEPDLSWQKWSTRRIGLVKRDVK